MAVTGSVGLAKGLRFFDKWRQAFLLAWLRRIVYQQHINRLPRGFPGSHLRHGFIVNGILHQRRRVNDK